ncbi:MAG: isoprenylcysteine carboxylmethyltransferase family protein [Planctomycetales bacterium]|nr:isoprenylcysteine carboxylmethyltransferase family protein [Planctomycetales bacterium]
MSSPPRIVDVAIGLSVLGWAIAGALSNHGNRPLAVLVATTLLHVIVAILFLVRRQAVASGSLRSCLFAAPAVLVGGWVFYLSPSQWSQAAQCLFIVGSGLAIVSLAILGRCFAVLPAIRGVVLRGPYALVRHPVYLGELIMVVACLVAAQPQWWHAAVLLVVIVAFVIRIAIEERLLMNESTYRSYCDDVRWRLVPMVW